ncbi:MAG: septal ring factor EnvC (AmiA/AmiB activator) [Desulforhopalus sp.]|jgi:septal ring factor EnvC (AmiA/AmiB activator)
MKPATIRTTQKQPFKPPSPFCCTRYRKLSICFLIQILFVTLALTSHGAPEKPTKNDVSGYRINIRRLQHGIVQQKNQISEARVQERGILDEIETLDNKLSIQREKLAQLNVKMEHQQTLINHEEKALNKIRSERDFVEKHLQKRITAYYTMGDIGLLNVTFSTKTLPELLTFHDSFDSLIKYDQDVIKVYRATIKDLERAKDALTLEKSILAEFIVQAKQDETILENTKADKRSLLTHIRTQTKLHKQAVEEMQEASEHLANSIVAIKNKNEAYEEGFFTNKGSLPPPVDGTIITLFQQEKTNKLGISRKSLGIELQAKDGTEIAAVSGGDVIYAGYLRGYGNTVIIHHGLQYYTVTSRIERILVEQGDKVEINDKIGVVGDTATLFDEGLYFEIRHGRQSLDPLLWLNPNRLSTRHESSS